MRAPKIPATTVISHNTVPKNDICNDFEYSLCLVKRESKYCVTISTATTAVSGGAYICNTTAAGFTLTLPNNPADNDHVLIIDGFGQFLTNNLTIGRAANAENIAGAASDLISDTNYASFRLTYKFDVATSTNYGWLLT